MIHKTGQKWFLICIILILLAPLLIAAAPAASGGKQIVLFIEDDNWRFVSVKITGTNQNGQEVTWSKKNSSGFNITYTKNYWWIEDFVRIDLVLENKSTRQSVPATCLIDALYQPSDSPRVEIAFLGRYGCVGGEAGSAQDPVRTQLKPFHNALNTVDYYLSDFNLDVFMQTVELEARAAVCIVAVGTAMKTGGLSLAVAEFTVKDSCLKTSEKILKLVFTKP